MFNFRTKEEKPSAVDPVIDALVDEMKTGWSSEDFKDQAASLKLLMEAKAAEPKPDKISLDTVAVIAGNLAGIVLILAFERSGVVTSKSLSMLARPRI